MKTIRIKGEIRENLGKKSAKSIRRNEMVPAVINIPSGNKNFYASIKEFNLLLFTPEVYIVEIELGTEVIATILKDSQFHPVSGEILHMDFVSVNDNKPVIVKVPIELVGFSEGVKAGGKMQTFKRKLAVRGIASQIPEKLEINVDHVQLGKSIKVGELAFENLQLLDSKNDVVCTVKLTRGTKATE